MFTHDDLAQMQAQSLKMQSWIRQQTFSPELEKRLRRFFSWEVAELILQVNQSTLRGRLAADPSLRETSLPCREVVWVIDSFGSDVIPSEARSSNQGLRRACVSEIVQFGAKNEFIEKVGTAPGNTQKYE